MKCIWEIPVRSYLAHEIVSLHPPTKRRELTCLVAVSLLLLLTTNVRLCSGSNDNELWTAVDLRWEVSEDWSLTFEESFRFNDHASNFFYEHSDFGVLCRSLADWLDLGLNYRAVYDTQENEWKEGRPYFSLGLHGSLYGFELRNSSRFEYRNRHDAKDVWRYRNKITINETFEHLRKRTRDRFKGKVKPYIAHEIFLDFEGEGINENRTYAGLSCLMSKQIIWDIHYIWKRVDSEGSPEKESGAVGTNLKFLF